MIPDETLAEWERLSINYTPMREAVAEIRRLQAEISWRHRDLEKAELAARNLLSERDKLRRLVEIADSPDHARGYLWGRDPFPQGCNPDCKGCEWERITKELEEAAK